MDGALTQRTRIWGGDVSLQSSPASDAHGPACNNRVALFDSMKSVSTVKPFANLDTDDEVDQNDLSALDQENGEAEATSRNQCCNKMCKQRFEHEFIAARLIEFCANIDAFAKKRQGLLAL